MHVLSQRKAFRPLHLAIELVNLSQVDEWAFYMNKLNRMALCGFIHVSKTFVFECVSLFAN